MNNTTALPFIPGVDALYGSMCLLFFLVGAPANFFCFLSFLNQRRTVSSFTYSCITLVDCVICVNALPVALTYFLGRTAFMFGSVVFCNIWGMTHRLLSSLSIFYVAVLSISRTYVLLRPFSKLNLLLVQIVVAIHFVSQVVFVTIPFWEAGGKFIYHAAFATCEVVDTPEKRFESEYNVLSRITYSMPILPILLSCIISVYIIRRDAAQLTDSLRRTKQYASVTIVVFTMIYAALNIPNTSISMFGWTLAIDQIEPTGYLLNFIYYMSIPLNATVNTLLYFIRMHTIRQSLGVLVDNIAHRRSLHFTEIFYNFRNGTVSQGKQSFKPSKRQQVTKVGETVSSPITLMADNIRRPLKDEDTTPV
eukprot:sb/3465959/